MTTPEYGVTPDGFKAKRLLDVKNQLETLFISEFGDVNLDPQSVIGQIIGIFSKAFADIWENTQDVYLSQYPNSASGVSLDNVVALTGITRLEAERTVVIGVAQGVENTLIPAGSLVRIPASNETFFSQETAFITRSNSVQNIIEVIDLQPITYTVVIDGQPYNFNLPNMVFSAPLVSGNIIETRINGVNLNSIPWVTDSDTTLNNLANEIETNVSLNGAVLSANVIAGNTIELTPAIGKSIVVNSVNVIGGGASYSETLRTPANKAQIITNLVGLLNTNSKLNAVGNDPLFTITATSTQNPYSLIVGSLLNINQTSSPITFYAQNFGAIPAPQGSLTQIVTPVTGWNTITNFEAGITGREQETDAELRLRRLKSLRIAGYATVESIRSRILQEVSGVTAVEIFENVTLTQTPIIVIFSIDFVSTNTIEVFADGVSLGVQTWAGSHLATINNIANVIKTRNEVLNAVVGGVGNREIEITLKDAQELILSFTILGSTPNPTYTLTGAIPPKSFETIVEGGSDQDIAKKIWETKPAGIQTYGNKHIPIVDSQGFTQTINYTRATPVYIWVKMTITLNPQQTFPPNGLLNISNSILTYGNALGIGVDVIKQKLESLAFLTSGVASATVQLAKTYNINDIPSYVLTDISIQDTEKSIFDISRINVGF